MFKTIAPHFEFSRIAAMKHLATLEAAKLQIVIEGSIEEVWHEITRTDAPIPGKMIANTLKAVIETGRPAFGTRLSFGLFKLLAPLTPKRSRSENWPV